jgi:GT2 family glycosyltransferase
MISIVVCSRNKELSKAFAQNIEATIQVDYEIIVIDNSENQHSIFSAYNTGFEQSKYPYLCFVHEDVLFRTNDWGNAVIEHLQCPETGIIGLAGGDLVTRVPASWSALTPSINIIQSDSSGRKKTRHFHYPVNFTGNKRSVVLLDGVFLCMRRELFEKIRFDENFNGFHGYDFDISLQSTVAGFTNYVIYNIGLEHFSKGRKDARYFRNLIAIFRKWEKHLPIIGPGITAEQLTLINSIEEKRLFELTRKMIKRGFSKKEIVEITEHYTRIVNTPKSLKRLKYMQLRIFLTRLFQSPQHLFTK